MPKTKKAAPAEEAVVKTETVVAAPVTEEKAPAAKKPAAKKAAAKKPAAKKPAAKKAAAEKKTPAKTRAPKAAVAAVFVQSAGKQATPDELCERAKADWAAKGNDLASMKKIGVYFNADDGMVYYAVNEDENSGSFAF